MFKDNCFFEEKYSSIIKVTGSDKFNFLQGIISNDTKILKTNLSLYSAILTPQGKFLTDFILSLHNESILIEVRNKNLDMFMKKLSMFKLRSNVSFEIISDLKIYLLNHDNLKLLDNVKNKKILDDPRFNNFFARVYIFGVKSNYNLENKSLYYLNPDEYKSTRLFHAVPDFSIDAIENKSLLMEMRFNCLNGISWDKGCYLGQEITARMYYRKITKKKISHVKINFESFVEEKVLLDNKVVGFMTSNDNKNGLAYISSDILEDGNNKILRCGDSTVIVSEPWWSKNVNP